MADVVESVKAIDEAVSAYNAVGSGDTIHRLIVAVVTHWPHARALSQAGAGGGVVEALEECEEYFDQRADADCDQDGFIPNREMRLLSVVRGALAALAPSPVDLHGAWTNQADQKAIRTQMTATPPVPPVPTASVEAVRDAWGFLQDRLLEFEQEIGSGEEEREWVGHVMPALSRFRSLLASIEGEADGELLVGSRIDMAWADGAKAVMNAVSEFLPDVPAVREMDRVIAQRQSDAIAGRKCALRKALIASLTPVPTQGDGEVETDERKTRLAKMIVETKPTPSSPVSAPSPAGARERGWLVELKGATPSWAILNPRDYDEHWTTDSTKAIRFAREADAQAYIDHIGWTEAFPSEHIWDDGRKAWMVAAPAVQPAPSPVGGVREVVLTALRQAASGGATGLADHEIDEIANDLLAALSSPATPEPKNWKMGEPVNPKHLANMVWVPYDEALWYLGVNTFLGRWREYDEQGRERSDRDRIAFCCQDEHGDVLALGSDGGELSSPSWRGVDCPDEILVATPEPVSAPAGEDAVEQAAIRIIRNRAADGPAADRAVAHARQFDTHVWRDAKRDARAALSIAPGQEVES